MASTFNESPYEQFGNLAKTCQPQISDKRRSENAVLNDRENGESFCSQ
jgi:hypothetical protein